MLDALRRGATTWVAKILLGLLVLSFAIWGIADVFRGGQTRAVAEVGDTEIDLPAFQSTYQRELQALSRQIGQPLTADMAAQFGLPQRVLGRMMAEATLTESARRLGLGVSDQTVATTIAADPSFITGGQFNRAQFQQLLRQAGLTEVQYLADQRELTIRQQVFEGLVGGLRVPTALVEPIARFRNEVRTVDYVVLERAAVEPIAPPTEDERTAYFEENKAAFRAPEYRKLQVVALTPAALADPSAVTDEAARAEYERTRGQYGQPEQRRVQQILFPTVEEAEAAATRIAGGTTFEAVAEERGLSATDLDLGLLAKSAMVDPAVADVAFGLAPNTVSAPVKARFGGALVRVTEVVPESIQPFEAVAGGIRDAIAQRTAERTLLETEQEIEDARAGGATLQEVADRFGLTLQTIEAVSAEGTDPAGQMVMLPDAEGLLAAAFESDVGVENDPLAVTGRGYAWFEVVSVTPARDRTLEEVSDQVVERWTNDQAAERLAERADQLVADVKGGKPFAEAAAGAGLTVTRSPAFARNGDLPGLGEVGVDAAFGGPDGYVTSVDADDGRQIVLQVVNAVVPPFFAEEAGNAEVATAFSEEMRESLITRYVDGLQASLGVAVNQQALDLAIGVSGR
ncbi:SurA N-terminal domain-containing protein [Mongoliimonas terrestris]|uniref:SurA N-terminal domain-containing protein n=1 Tax=Mongoliimonas terrestris TaxID=1709001 RepID=UPI0009499034|nr:SurA N-terminal domain-containing protein [Mongoliimonas terrestris]